jgi:hypothetical protein
MIYIGGASGITLHLFCVFGNPIDDRIYDEGIKIFISPCQIKNTGPDLNFSGISGHSQFSNQVQHSTWVCKSSFPLVTGPHHSLYVHHPTTFINQTETKMPRAKPSQPRTKKTARASASQNGLMSSAAASSTPANTAPPATPASQSQQSHVNSGTQASQNTVTIPWSPTQSQNQPDQSLANTQVTSQASQNSQIQPINSPEKEKSKSLTWTPAMERSAVELYVRAVESGKQAEGGFKPEVHPWVASELLKEFPGNPFTASKVKSKYTQGFKKIYDAFVACKGASGFGWNEAECMVTASDDVWNAFLVVSMSVFTQCSVDAEVVVWPLFSSHIPLPSNSRTHRSQNTRTFRSSLRVTLLEEICDNHQVQK